MNLRDQIFNVSDILEEEVTVKEWGVKLLIKGLSAKQRSGLLNDAVEMVGNKPRMNFNKLFPDLVILTAHDPETGQRVFEPTDRELLNSKSGAALETIAKVAMRLSGMDDETKETIEKN